MKKQWGRGRVNQQLVFSTMQQQKINTVSGFFAYCYLKM